jgi:hypothetical protein
MRRSSVRWNMLSSQFTLGGSDPRSSPKPPHGSVARRDFFMAS